MQNTIYEVQKYSFLHLFYQNLGLDSFDRGYPFNAQNACFNWKNPLRKQTLGLISNISQFIKKGKIEYKIDKIGT